MLKKGGIMSMISRPNYEDAPAYCRYYFDLLPEDDLLEALVNSGQQAQDLMRSIPASMHNYSYAPGKWTLKMVFAHLADCERVYAYRALRFSRKDSTELAAFNEDQFALNANPANRNLQQIEEELDTLRKSTIQLFSYMSDDMLDHLGLANKSVFSARSLGWLAAGHCIHHCRVVKERYLGMSSS
jgi:hypothetical protein